MAFKYKGVVCSDLQLIGGFIDEILNKLSNIIDNGDIMFDIRLILNELVINGAMHGNKSISTKCVNLSLEIQNGRLIIEVEDEGRGFHCDLMKYNPMELKTCGRGLVIVNGLSDEFYVDNNRVIAIKNIN